MDNDESTKLFHISKSLSRIFSYSKKSVAKNEMLMESSDQFQNYEFIYPQKNWCQTLYVYLFFAILLGQIYKKLI